MAHVALLDQLPEKLQAHLDGAPVSDRSGLRGMTEVLARSPAPRQSLLLASDISSRRPPTSTTTDCRGVTWAAPSGDNGKSGGGLSDRRSREGVDNDEEYDEQPSEDPGGEPAEGDEEEEAPAPRRRAAMAGAGAGGRPARGRQGRRNG